MLVDQLHEKFPSMQDLRVRDIRVDKAKRKVLCVVSYPNVATLDTVIKNAIISFVRGSVPKGYTCDVKMENDSFTELLFRQFLFKYIKERYPIFNVSKERTAISIVDKNISVLFATTALNKTNLETANFCQDLREYFLCYTSYQVSFEIKVDKTIPTEDFGNLDDQERLVRLAINKELLRPSRHFSVKNVEKYVGKLIQGSPMYISDIRGPMENCILCGKVSSKTLKATAKDKTLYMCKFNLSDDSGANITCVLFVRFDIADFQTLKQTTNKPDSEVLTISRTKAAANDKKMKKLMNIYDGLEVIVRGKISHNNFSDRLEMMVFDMCLCRIEAPSNLKNIAPVPPSYLIVQPEYFEEYKQASFTEKLFVNEQFSQKKYVVLHANVTGYTPAKDKVLALCGTKIENGHIVEKFFTYVNPEISIDEGLASLIKLDASKLVFHHTLTELIPDLYKFTYGYQLVGSDLRKLVELLDYYAVPFGYKFVNTLLDQSDLLSRMFDEGIFKKKPNCAKLEDVAKTCKVPFEKSDFCLDTSPVVANCMLVLADNIGK